MKLIHQLSRETGIPIGTIRYYEKIGLLTGIKKEGTKTNNYTYYSDEVVEKLSFIKDAKTVGFTLVEIKEVIGAWHNNTLSKTQKMKVLQNKISQTETKIMELKNIRNQLLECLGEIENS